MLLAGCGTQPDMAGTQASAELDRVRRAATASEALRARSLAKNGELHDAVQAWRIVHALGVEQEVANREIASLQARIAATVDGHVAAAKRELEQGRWRTARNQLLAALALEPKDRQAQELLRASETRRALAQLQETPVIAATPPEYSAEARPATASDAAKTQPATTVPARAQVQAGPATDDSKSLAQEAYKRGLALYPNDKSAAARAFKRATELDPTHVKAQAYLKVLNRLGVQ